MSRKKDDFMGGIDELPSGNVEEGETLYEALIREVKEEINLDVKKISSYINCFDYISGNGKKARQYNFAIVVDLTSDIKLTEHDEYKWLSINDVRNNSNITDEVKIALEIYYFNFIQDKNI